MSQQDHMIDPGTTPFASVTQEQFDQERMTRRAMLRRLGITAGASLFGIAAIDDVARLTVAKMREQETLRGLTDALAKDFRSTGIALAQGPGGNQHCGVTIVPCIKCPSPIQGGPPLPPCTEPYCNHCAAPTDCTDCSAVALYKHCNCMQSIINNNPGCFDSNGQPLGTCPQITVPIANCDAQYEQALENCP